MTQTPIACLIYDFDKTLSPRDMQEYGFLPGLGIPPERLAQLRDMLRSDGSALEDRSGFGIGLRNTNRRIKLLYGPQYGLTIESEVEERTCITITLPKRRR